MVIWSWLEEELSPAVVDMITILVWATVTGSRDMYALDGAVQ
jgi:hypothetical protein